MEIAREIRALFLLQDKQLFIQSGDLRIWAESSRSTIAL